MNIIFIKGAKQSVVDFINRGLKGCKSKVRISANLSGEQIADRLNGHDCSIDMNSYLPIPATFLHYDTTNGPLSFCEWYALGCLDYSDNFDKDMYHTRWQEINDYLKAHPERFTADEDEEYSAADLDKALKEIHPELFDAYRKYIHRYYCAASYQKRKYGVVGWEDWGMEHYGCPASVPMNQWKVKNETQEELCLSFELIDTLDYPISFLKYINGIDGIAVFAYGFEENSIPSWYHYDGQKDEVVWKEEAEEDLKFTEYLEAYKKQAESNPRMANSEALYKMLEDYVREFKKNMPKK